MGRPKKELSEDKGNITGLDIAMKSLETQFGKGLIFDLGKVTLPDIDKVSFGSLRIDKAAGGGYAKGRIVEIYGPESSGKTTLACTMIREAQNDPAWKTAGRKALFIDAEHALDLAYAERLGVDRKSLIITQPDTMQQAMNIAETLIQTGLISVCVVDSVSAMTPREILEGEMGDHHMGLQARLMSQALMKLNVACAKTGTALIFINQIRMKIGVMFGNRRKVAA